MCRSIGTQGISLVFRRQWAALLRWWPLGGVPPLLPATCLGKAEVALVEGKSTETVIITWFNGQIWWFPEMGVPPKFRFQWDFPL